MSRELPQCLTLNTSLVALSIFVIYSRSFNPVLFLHFFRVSHFSLLIFVLFQTCHTFVNSFILLPYSGFQLLLFLGRVPNKPLDIANLFRPCKHDSRRFDPPLSLQQQLLRLSFVPTMRRNRTFGSASSRLSLQRQESNCKNSNTPMPLPVQPAQASPMGHFRYS